jgi:hypothetical protein
MRKNVLVAGGRHERAQPRLGSSCAFPIATCAEAGGGLSFIHVLRLAGQFGRRTRSFVPSQ